ncbi:hypothetical protein D3C87_1353040 [compost metagenome]
MVAHHALRRRRQVLALDQRRQIDDIAGAHGATQLHLTRAQRLAVADRDRDPVQRLGQAQLARVATLLLDQPVQARGGQDGFEHHL